MKTAMLGIPLVLCATPAFAQATDRPSPRWSITVLGGGLVGSGDDDQTYASLAVSHDVSDALAITLTGTYIDSREAAGVRFALPAKTYQGKIAADLSLGAVAVGGYASYGQRNFSADRYLSRTGTSVSLDGHGDVYGVGGSMSYDLAIGRGFFVSPQVSIAYDRADVARVITVPAVGARALNEKQDGVTGTAGAALQTLFGPNGDSGAAFSLNYAASSNTAAYHAGSAGAPVATAGALDDADDWFELGASGTLSVNRHVALTGSALRTLGFSRNDGTTLTLGVRFDF